jgi:hypothetical protein
MRGLSNPLLHTLVVGIVYGTSTLVGLLLLAAALLKFRAWKRFSRLLGDYVIVPRELVPAIAVLLPCAELCLGVSLAIRIWMPAPAILASMLFVFFGVAIAGNLVSGKSEQACGCLGSGAGVLTWGMVLRNIALAVAVGMSCVPVNIN